MTPHSILTPDDRTPPQPAGERRPLLSFRRSDGSAASSAPAASAELPVHRDLAPKIVLRLPDLTLAGDVESENPWRWGNVAYWAGIVLGALLALYLIGGGRRKPVDQQFHDAPAWNATPQANAPAESNGGPAADAGAGSSTVGAPLARMARRIESPGGGVQVQPGQAAPLGITTPVQP